LITLEGAENHPDANVITRSLGMSPMNDDGRPDIETVQLAAGDQLLLCSDGLSGLVHHERIATAMLLAGRELERAASELLKFALAEGGHDNITIGLVQMIPEEEEQQDHDEPAKELGATESREAKLTSEKGEEHGKDTN
jgi:protein phosphatase